jgi:hypothetical protein
MTATHDHHPDPDYELAQLVHDHHPEYELAQLAVLSVAAIVLLVFAWMSSAFH